MFIKIPLYTLDDISIIPAISTKIKSRSEVCPFVNGLHGEKEFYPLIAAPMDSVVTLENLTDYENNGIMPIVPRTFSFDIRFELMGKYFCGFGLNEALSLINKELVFPEKQYILLDVANGSMEEQIEVGKKLREFFGSSLTLMGGNIGNPYTYELYDAAGFDFVRVGIGDGHGCLTSTQTGVNYPYASLISDIMSVKVNISHPRCKIIADGGMDCYSDIIKCLALGADYVMCGMLFAKATKKNDLDKIGQDFIYRGMSTKSAQQAMGNSKLKTSEGKILTLKKEYTLEGWCENFRDYLRSAMSYCDCKTLDEFKTKAVCQVISPNASNKINNK